MIWVVVLGLGLWCFLQQDRLNNLVRQIAELRAEITRLTIGAPAEAPQIAPTVEAADPPILAEPVLASPPLAPVEPVAWEPEPALAALAEPVSQVAPEEPAPPAKPSRSAADWLSENGLAWIGGGALALGGLFLVAYAAQRGLFGPPMRIGAAVVLGLAALAAGEALRRGLGGREPNRLVAALTTGAGAAILFGAIWAAYRLYGFIPAGGAAALLAGVSFGLLALALLHGEALGVLAIAGAYVTPVICATPGFPKAPLDIFIGLILATGIAIASLRRWRVAALVTLGGAGVWALGRVFDADPAGASALALAAPLLILAGMLARPQRSAEPEAPARPAVPMFLISVILASVVAWVVCARNDNHGLMFAMSTLAGIAACIAAADRVGRGQRLALLAPVIATGLAALIAPKTSADVLWLIFAVLASATAGLVSAGGRGAARQPAMIGAAAAAVTMTLLIGPLAVAMPGLDWAIDAGVAALLAAGAASLALRSADAKTDLASGAWIAAAAEVMGLALHASLDPRATPIAYGVLGLALAALALRLRWRGFAEAAAVACLAGFAALLQPKIAWAAITSHQAWLMIAAITVGAVLAQVATWLTLKAKRDAAGAAEAASTLAVMTGLLGAFLVIQTLGQPKGGGAMMGAFAQASVRTLLLLAAGLMLTLRGAATPIGRFRAPVLLALGAAHGVLLEVLILNPWWGFGGHVAGPPLFDNLFLGLLAPGLVLGETARRAGKTGNWIAGPSFGVGLGFLAIWILTEIRRLFHGPDLSSGPVTHAEAAAYGVAILALAALLDLGRLRLSRALSGGSTALGEVFGAFTWFGLGVGLFILAYTAAPWWGPLDGDLVLPTVFFALYVMAAALSAGLAILARRAQRTALANGALIAASIEVFVLLSLAIRFTFHGGAMREPLREASLETWTFSAIWALYGLAMLSGGAFRRDGPLRIMGLALLLLTTVKVFLFDLGHLDGVARAASFLALGVALLVAALAARRFGAAGARKDAG
jgi:hypothetical protein